jgi:hypothetical protein
MISNSQWPQQLTHLQGALATPTVVNTSQHTFTGVIYDCHGSICREAQRTRWGGNEWQPSDPEVIALDASLPTLPGRSLYLGHYTGHYGHFLMETLARLWALGSESLEANGFDRVVFHPFLHKTPAVKKFSPACISFSAFGIEARQVVMVDRPLRFESLTVPPAALEINCSVSPVMAATYRRIIDYCLPRKSASPGFWRNLQGWSSARPLRLYLSRRRAKGFHSMINERQVENVFLDAGFRVMHPEHWRFEQQVALFQRAEIIAGVEGSALHNSVFMRPGQRVINIGTPREPTGNILNQRLCDNLSGALSGYIPFEGEVIRGSKALYDIDFLRSALKKVL